MGELLWWCVAVQLVMAGSMVTVGSIDLRWWWQDRSERALGWTGVLCCAVALVLVIGSWGLSFPEPAVWHVVLPVRALLIGSVVAVFLTTLGTLVTLPGVRVAAVGSLLLSAVFVVLGFTGGQAYVFVGSTPWPQFQPLGNLLVATSLVLLAGYSFLALRRLSGPRRRQLAAALLTAAVAVVVALGAGPGLPAEVMTTLWTVPIAALLAWWCSSRVLTLQGSLSSAVKGWETAEQEARYQARHDRLTGLPNLAAAAETLQSLLDSAGPEQSTMVTRVQLNRLEHVRAVDGVHSADQVLRDIADHLVALLPTDAAVARVGEVAFVVMTQGPVNRPMSHLEATVAESVAQLRRAAQLPAELAVLVGIAIGGSPATAQELLHRSVVAVTAAEQTQNSVQVYRRELLDGIVRRARTIRLLTAAVDRDELELHYQPVVDTASLEMVGVEALVRWRHHGRLHPPSEWIPIAEEQGLMPAIGTAVLRLAARDHAALGCPIAVNVSPRQLTDARFAATVLEALGDCPPSAIILEITETCIAGDVPTVYASLETLRGHGVRVAVDDFGTEYSSLSRLALVPFDILKIDRSFVERLDCRDGRAMVTAIHAMAGGLGKLTVAEGVETAEQLKVLRDIGCDRIQGFLTGRPASLADLVRRDGKSSRSPNVLQPRG